MRRTTIATTTEAKAVSALRVAGTATVIAAYSTVTFAGVGIMTATATIVRRDGTKARRRVGAIAMCRPDKPKSRVATTTIAIIGQRTV